MSNGTLKASTANNELLTQLTWITPIQLSCLRYIYLILIVALKALIFLKPLYEVEGFHDVNSLSLHALFEPCHWSTQFNGVRSDQWLLRYSNFKLEIYIILKLLIIMTIGQSKSRHSSIKLSLIG